MPDNPQPPDKGKLLAFPLRPEKAKARAKTRKLLAQKQSAKDHDLSISGEFVPVDTLNTESANLKNYHEKLELLRAHIATKGIPSTAQIGFNENSCTWGVYWQTNEGEECAACYKFFGADKGMKRYLEKDKSLTIYDVQEPNGEMLIMTEQERRT